MQLRKKFSISLRDIETEKATDLVLFYEHIVQVKYCNNDVLM